MKLGFGIGLSILTTSMSVDQFHPAPGFPTRSNLMLQDLPHAVFVFDIHAGSN